MTNTLFMNSKERRRKVINVSISLSVFSLLFTQSLTTSSTDKNFRKSNFSSMPTKENPAEIYLTKYKVYSRDIKRLLIACGIWPSLHPTFRTVITSLAIAALSLGFFGTLNFSLHHISDIMVFTKNIGLAISLPGIILKICTFLSYRDDLKSLNNQLSAYFLRDLDNPDYQPLALHYYQSFANLFYTLTWTVGVTCVLKILAPLLALMHGNYLTTMPVMYPFKYEPGSLIYWLLQAMDGFGAFLIWTATCGVDNLFGLYTLQICGELRVLAYKFERLKASVDYKKDIEDCIKRHHMLMRSLDTLERIFSILVFWLAITSGIILCTFMFQMTVMLKTRNINEIMYTVTYITLKVIQAFMYAWYGTLITEESQLCLDAMYNAAWAGSGSKRLMRDVLIVVSQRPLVFTAKGCLKVRMEIFLKILHTSGSYFCLLQALDQGEAQG